MGGESSGMKQQWFESWLGIMREADNHAIRAYQFCTPEEVIAELIKRMEAKGETVPDGLRTFRIKGKRCRAA